MIDQFITPQTPEVYKAALQKVQEAAPVGIDLKLLAKGAANPGPAHWKLMRHAFGRMLISGKLKLTEEQKKKPAHKSPGSPPFPPKPSNEEVVRLTGKIRQLAVSRATLANKLIPNPIEQVDIDVNLSILDEMVPIVDEMEALEIQRRRLQDAGHLPHPQIVEPVSPEVIAHHKQPVVTERNGTSYTLDQLYALTHEELTTLKVRLVKTVDEAGRRKVDSKTEKARQRNAELEEMTKLMIKALDRVRFDKQRV
jgi:hypothetical protein